jgi:hypothetical protein
MKSPRTAVGSGSTHLENEKSPMSKIPRPGIQQKPMATKSLSENDLDSPKSKKSLSSSPSSALRSAIPQMVSTKTRLNTPTKSASLHEEAAAAFAAAPASAVLKGGAGSDDGQKVIETLDVEAINIETEPIEMESVAEEIANEAADSTRTEEVASSISHETEETVLEVVEVIEIEEVVELPAPEDSEPAPHEIADLSTSTSIPVKVTPPGDSNEHAEGTLHQDDHVMDLHHRDEVMSVFSDFNETASIFSHDDFDSHHLGSSSLSTSGPRRNFKAPIRRRRKIDMTDLTGLATLISSRLADLQMYHAALLSSSSSVRGLKTDYVTAAKDIVLLGRGIATAWQPVAKACSDKRLAERLIGSLAKLDTLAAHMKVIVKMKSNTLNQDKDAEGLVIVSAKNVVEAANAALSDLESAQLRLGDENGEGGMVLLDVSDTVAGRSSPEPVYQGESVSSKKRDSVSSLGGGVEEAVRVAIAAGVAASGNVSASTLREE